MSSSKKQHGSRNPVAELASLLQEANEKYDKLKTLYDHLKNTYDELYQTHLTLQNSLLCESCKNQMDKMKTEDGGTVELCHTCSLIGEGQNL